MTKAEKIKRIAKRYYSQKSIQKVMFETAKDREVVPLYFDSFGKRPDAIIYEGDIKSLIDKGATSFHCSEERWKDPLKLEVGLSKTELNNLRKGWDFLIDIDCKFIEYSKMTASLLRDAFYFHNIQTFGIKFSGGTGFHLCVASEAFPKEIFGIKLKDYFPEAARFMLDYLKSMIEKELSVRIQERDSIKEISEKTGKSEKELTIKGEFNPYAIVTLDSGLISSRHLFRMPFSLNEKTLLSSVVIRPNLIEKFNPKIAKPSDFVSYRPFIKIPETEEGKELLIQALDWKKKIKMHDLEKRRIVEIKGKVEEEDFPPSIKKALQGMKKDGRKRCLFILINFFRSINMPDDEIEKKLKEWNQKNYKPLSETYMQTQLNWYKKQAEQGKKFPPPNYNHPFYKEIGIFTSECEIYKNPLSYVARHLRVKRRRMSKSI
ncbi:hypothetical protein B6U80_01600 [Candidatus Pacearchaeota archaeon ex4484_26]|nr:MAG: hypothetical protein B6U80_01600 [Candidatus Pacearchaeota archaeon ex4484_26]